MVHSSFFRSRPLSLGPSVLLEMSHGLDLVVHYLDFFLVLFPGELPLQLLQHMHLVRHQILLVLTIHVHVLQELVELLLVRLWSFDQHDVSLGEVDDLLIEGIDENFVVAIHWFLREAEEQPLRNVVLAIKVTERTYRIYLILIFKRVCRGEKSAGHPSEMFSLRWVHQVLDQNRLLRLVVTHSPKKLILVNKSELSACRIHLHLLHPHVRHFRVLNHA